MNMETTTEFRVRFDPNVEDEGFDTYTKAKLHADEHSHGRAYVIEKRSTTTIVTDWSRAAG